MTNNTPTEETIYHVAETPSNKIKYFHTPKILKSTIFQELKKKTENNAI